MHHSIRIAGSGAFGILLVALTAACGDSTQPPPPAPAPAERAAPATSPAASTTSERDIAAIEACQLITAEEVATIAGGKPAVTESAWTGPRCMYVIEVADATEGYGLNFSAANEIAVVVDLLPPQDRGEAVPGPWQEAYLGPKPFGEGLRMLVLDRDDFAFAVDGESRREPILEVARRAYERVK